MTLSQDIILKLIFLFVWRSFHILFWNFFVCPIECVRFMCAVLLEPFETVGLLFAWEITNSPVFFSFVFLYILSFSNLTNLCFIFISFAITLSDIVAWQHTHTRTHLHTKSGTESSSIDSVVIFNYHFFASIFTYTVCSTICVTWSIDFYSYNKFDVDGFRWKLSPPCEPAIFSGSA